MIEKSVGCIVTLLSIGVEICHASAIIIPAACLARKGGALMFEFCSTLMLNVLAGMIVYIIGKWLDTLGK